MLISAINTNINRKNNYSNTKENTFINNKSSLQTQSRDSFSCSKPKDISFGLIAKDFPFSYETFDFIIPNNVLRRVKPHIQKLIQEIEIPSEDGLKLKSWFVPPKDTSKPIFLFLNGTNSNRTQLEEVVKFFDKNGYGALMPDYRGFGGNPGVATEEGLYKDAGAALKYLNDNGHKDKDLVLWGYSMGGAVARKIMTENKFKFAIIDSAIKNEYMIKKHFLDSGIANKEHISPVTLRKLKNQIFEEKNIPFDTTENIKNVKYPILFLHSEGDYIVPHRMTKEQRELSSNMHSNFILEKGTNPHFYRNWTFKHVQEYNDTIDKIINYQSSLFNK